MIEQPSTSPAVAEAAIPVVPARRPSHRGVLRRMMRVPWAIVPYVVFLTIAILMALFGLALAPYDPIATSLRFRLVPPAILGGDNAAFLFGTDQLGRDVFSRVIAGSQISLVVGIAGLVLAGVLGTLVGLVAGYAGGFLDEALMSLADIQLAFPNVLLAIAVIAV